MNDDSETISGEGFGFKVKATGRKLLSENLLLLAFIFSMAGFIWYHHQDTSEKLMRLNEALGEVNFILTLSQEDREALRLRMPESLKRKSRRFPQPDQ